MIDTLSYGEHSALGKTLDISEERDPGNYVGRHRHKLLDLGDDPDGDIAGYDGGWG
jgi:hypothetical protein